MWIRKHNHMSSNVLRSPISPLLYFSYCVICILDWPHFIDFCDFHIFKNIMWTFDVYVVKVILSNTCICRAMSSEQQCYTGLMNNLKQYSWGKLTMLSCCPQSCRSNCSCWNERLYYYLWWIARIICSVFYCLGEIYIQVHASHCKEYQFYQCNALTCIVLHLWWN